MTDVIVTWDNGAESVEQSAFQSISDVRLDQLVTELDAAGLGVTKMFYTDIGFETRQNTFEADSIHVFCSTTGMRTQLQNALSSHTPQPFPTDP